MNRNQVKGAAKDVAGKVQQEVGEVTGNKTQEVVADIAALAVGTLPRPGRLFPRALAPRQMLPG